MGSIRLFWSSLQEGLGFIFTVMTLSSSLYKCSYSQNTWFILQDLVHRYWGCSGSVMNPCIVIPLILSVHNIHKAGLFQASLLFACYFSLYFTAGMFLEIETAQNLRMKIEYLVIHRCLWCYCFLYKNSRLKQILIFCMVPSKIALQYWSNKNLMVETFACL